MPNVVDREEVRALAEAGATLVEVLPAQEYEEEHLPGAVNVPLDGIDRAASELDRSRPVVVYCYDHQ